MVDSGDDTRKKRECPQPSTERHDEISEIERKSTANKKFRPQDTKQRRSGEPLDIETALHRLLNGNEEEKLDGLAFRVGHTGDAPPIEAFYRRTTIQSKEAREQQQESSPLELWLSEGLGDEDTPPSVYSIVAQRDGDKNALIEAVALFSLEWKTNQRVLRVEWSHVDPSVPNSQAQSRRMWLYLSALAVMTGACLSFPEAVDRSESRSGYEKTAQERRK